jgi:hypothetical protein
MKSFRALLLSFAALVVNSHADQHWAYAPPIDSTPPGDAATHPIDAFLLDTQKKAGLKPTKLAAPRQWIERASFTLTGLPATQEQIARIEKNPDEATWKAMVDELLASPAYGERWARHWMDVARYADTQGYNFDKDNRYPFAYTYRDWLIKAFNDDMPFGKFVKLQIAADLIVDRPDHPDLAALGFLTVGPRAGPLEMIDDRVDVITRGFLSSTVACARCHDHKTDPITTKDFYSLYSILENAVEPGEKPIIGKPADEAAHQAFLAESAKLQEKENAARQETVDQLRTPATSAVYLELAWLAKTEKWDAGKTSGEAFKRGRFRLKGVEKWKDFLEASAASPRIAAWNEQMTPADDAGRKAASLALATEWSQGAADSELAKLAADGKCPLAFGQDRVNEIWDAEDDNQRRSRAGAVAKLEIEHPGSTPRAMSLSDRPKYMPAQVYVRGNPGNRSEPFDRAWLSFLGGGKFPDDKSPRLSLAEKIADPANPLTARVIVNRVWGWQFGQGITDPADFGPQQPLPPLRPLLDWLALRFNEKGGSIKELQRLILTSKAFRLDSEGPKENNSIDEANNLFWKWNRHRVDFEAMRDRILATAGTLDTSSTGGRSISLDKESSDKRRSVYAFIDRYALPGTFVSFDLPHPDLHAPKRAETTVPQQALYFLNGPLVIREAEKTIENPDFTKQPDDNAKVRWIYERLFQREPIAAETKDAVDWVKSANPADYEPRVGGVWEIRHAVDAPGPLGDLLPFPVYDKKTWKTGPDLDTAPIKYLNAHADGGHPANGHVLVVRWRATGSGQVKMIGTLTRPAKEGAPLVWQVVGKNTEVLSEGQLLPEAKDLPIDGKWIDVKAGDTVDFTFRAPQGEHFGSTNWSIKMLGRESHDADPIEISNLKEQFPTTTSPPPVIPPASPWADLVQMLWASNEFHFID